MIFLICLFVCLLCGTFFYNVLQKSFVQSVSLSITVNVTNFNLSEDFRPKFKNTLEHTFWEGYQTWLSVCLFTKFLVLICDSSYMSKPHIEIYGRYLNGDYPTM